MAEIKLTERVSIDNLVSWDCHFRAIESNRDIVIPAKVKGYKQLTLGEVDGQVKLGNKFFCGVDTFGSNASFKINDEKVKEYVFGTNENKQDSTQLDLNTVKKLLGTTPKTAFMDSLKKIVSTEAEKKMIIPLSLEIGIDNIESYKISAIEKHSGINFK